jgi:hypothetical protein
MTFIKDEISSSPSPSRSARSITLPIISSQEKETVNNEIVFLLVPHLVRRIDITPLNLRTMDTGTGTNVTLRMDPSMHRELSQGSMKQNNQAASAPAASVITIDNSGPGPSSTAESASHLPSVEDAPTISSEPRLQLFVSPN